MKFKIMIILVLFALVGCQGQEPGSGLVDDDDVILVLVDGDPVTLPMLEYMMAQRNVSEDDHDGMREILEELIRLRAVANAAREEGLDREPRVRARRLIQDLETLQLRYFDQVYRDYPVTDEDVAAIYQAQLERAGDQQFQIEAILYGDQSEALRQIARLEDGEATFDELLASAQATGLGVDEPLWVDRSQLPEDVAVLLAETEVGEAVGLPLQTPQGWRVLRVTDTRPIEVPSLEQVREGISRHLVRQRLEALVEDLYEAAEITPMLPLEDASPEAD
jgi:peptidyl-prolyl cis-trans isomerase C